MSWQVEWLEEAAKDMRRLGKAEQKQVLKGIAKVSENPLPSSQGGYGKPLRNANRAHLAGLCKIKFRDLGIRVVYRPVLKEGTIESIHAKMVLNMVQIPDKEIVMFNSLDVLDDLVPVSELSNGRTSAVLNKADRAPVIIKRNRTSYMFMSINIYQNLFDRLEDKFDACLADARIAENDGRRNRHGL